MLFELIVKLMCSTHPVNMYRGHSCQFLNYIGKEDDEPLPPTMTRSSGEPIPNYRSSQTVGPRGPPLFEDHILLEDLQHTMRGRVPERRFHARGSGTHGFFEVTNDITKYCDAKLFNEVGKRTPILARFSVAGSRLGTAETLRPGMRGMAVKFYTEEGNWDILCNSAPVFLFNDPMLVASGSNSGENDPASNLADANRVMDVLSLRPESTFFQIWMHSDAALPFSYRHMDTFAMITYKLINRHGEPTFVRFSLKTDQGVRSMAPARAAQLAGTNPDYATQDLVEAIERGDYPSWVLRIQAMSVEEVKTLDFNPFEATKLWPEDHFPWIDVGRVTMNRNTANHFDEVEQAAFSPGNLVPGIRAAEFDKIFVGRILAYPDTQNYRLGVNRNQLPVNRPLNPVRNYQREGRGVFISQGSAPHYFPNSFGGPMESTGAQELDPSYKACDMVGRFEDVQSDHFIQPRQFWIILTPDHQERIVTKFGALLRTLLKPIQKRVLVLLGNVDKELKERVEEAIDELPDSFI